MDMMIPHVAVQAEFGRMELAVFEDDRPAAARVHHTDAQEEPVRIPGLPRIARVKEADPGRREEILHPHLEARRFWNDLLERAEP